MPAEQRTKTHCSQVFGVCCSCCWAPTALSVYSASNAKDMPQGHTLRRKAESSARKARRKKNVKGGGELKTKRRSPKTTMI